MYIFARPSNSALNSRADLTDTFLSITNVSIQFANQNTLLSSATQEQLFMINTKNHGSFSWEEWSGLGLNNSAFTGTVGAAQYGGTGSVLCLEFGTDIQLDGDEAPGLSGQYQIQVQASFANKNKSGAWDNIPMTFYLIFISEGTFTITGTGSAQHQLGVLSKMDILDAQKMKGINYRDIERVNGGDFLGSLSNFANKVHDFLKSSKIISTVSSAFPHPLAQLGSNVARNLGYGEDEGGVAIGGVAVGGCGGGKRMTKQQIRRTLMDR
jgi:hypothetical protein